MKILLVSDIHSNLPALRAVFRAVQRKKIPVTVCLGDIVGYGAQPNQVLDLLQRRKGEKVFIRGNHDRVGSGAGDPLGFNHPAREAAIWTRTRLTPANRAFLLGMTVGPLAWGDLLFCHGSPGDEDEYIFSDSVARSAFAETDARVVLFGHTHLPSVFRLSPDGEIAGDVIAGEATVELQQGWRYLVNPGSVGQPRDRDPRASFAILDEKRISFRRVVYPVAEAGRAIRAAGLPSILADRLLAGF
ncbi:MAG: metallophosphoesterase [Thermoanaerobaculia bacterium]